MSNESNNNPFINIITKILPGLVLFSLGGICFNFYFSKNETPPKEQPAVTTETTTTPEVIAEAVPEPSVMPTQESAPVSTPSQSNGTTTIKHIVEYVTPFPTSTQTSSDNDDLNSDETEETGKTQETSETETSQFQTDVLFDSTKHVLFVANSDADTTGTFSIRRKSMLVTETPSSEEATPIPDEATPVPDEDTNESENSTEEPDDSETPNDNTDLEEIYEISDICNTSDDMEEEVHIIYVEIPSGEYEFNFTEYDCYNINIYILDDVNALCNSSENDAITEPMEEPQSIVLNNQNNQFETSIIPSYSFDSEIKFYSEEEANGTLEILDENYTTLATITLNETVSDDSSPALDTFEFTEENRYYLRITAPIEDDTEHTFHFIITE